MVSRRNQTLLSLSIFLGVLAWNVAAAAIKGETGGVPVGQLSVHEIEEQLQVCLMFDLFFQGVYIHTCYYTTQAPDARERASRRSTVMSRAQQ